MTTDDEPERISTGEWVKKQRDENPMIVLLTFVIFLATAVGTLSGWGLSAYGWLEQQRAPHAQEYAVLDRIAAGQPLDFVQQELGQPIWQSPIADGYTESV